MQTVTRKGTTLTVHLAAIHRVPAGHPEPIVEFRYPGGILCSSYYLSTFLEIPAGEGLWLAGGIDNAQQLEPQQVQACQLQCQAWMQEMAA
jgi:hypothetical protein